MSKETVPVGQAGGIYYPWMDDYDVPEALRNRLVQLATPPRPGLETPEKAVGALTAGRGGLDKVLGARHAVSFMNTFSSLAVGGTCYDPLLARRGEKGLGTWPARWVLSCYDYGIYTLEDLDRMLKHGVHLLLECCKDMQERGVAELAKLLPEPPWWDGLSPQVAAALQRKGCGCREDVAAMVDRRSSRKRFQAEHPKMLTRVKEWIGEAKESPAQGELGLEQPVSGETHLVMPGELWARATALSDGGKEDTETLVAIGMHLQDLARGTAPAARRVLIARKLDTQGENMLMRPSVVHVGDASIEELVYRYLRESYDQGIPGNVAVVVWDPGMPGLEEWRTYVPETRVERVGAEYA